MLEIVTTYNDKESEYDTGFCEVHSIFKAMDLDCFILNNSGHIILEVIVLFFIKLLIMALRSYSAPKPGFTGKPSLFHRVVVFIEDKIGFVFFL